MSNTIANARIMARGVMPWTPEESHRLRMGSLAEMRHDHKDLAKIRPASERELVRENCAACALSMTGRHPKLTGKEPPNHCNWLRTRLQLRQAIPGAWFETEMNEIEKRNPSMYNAILRDIRTYGLREFIRPGKVVEA